MCIKNKQIFGDCWQLTTDQWPTFGLDSIAIIYIDVYVRCFICWCTNNSLPFLFVFLCEHYHSYIKPLSRYGYITCVYSIARFIIIYCTSIDYRCSLYIVHYCRPILFNVKLCMGVSYDTMIGCFSGQHTLFLAENSHSRHLSILGKGDIRDAIRFKNFLIQHRAYVQ